MKRRNLLGGMLLAPLFVACGAQKKAFQTTDLSAKNLFPRLELPDGDGRLRNIEEFRNKVVVLLFGYTRCTEDCPAALRKYATLLRALRSETARQVQVIFVSIDPERDAPQHADTFAQWFSPAFLGLSGSPEKIAALTAQFELPISRKPVAGPLTYTIEHPADAYLIDRKGQVRLRAEQTAPIEYITEDIQLLLDEK